MKSAEEGRFRTFLVHRAATDADLAQPFLVDDPPFKRRRRPLRRVKLFHVIHEIDADRGGGTSIEKAEDSRLARGRNDLDVRESGIASELRHILGTLRIVAVLGRDRGQSDPVLQPLHILVMHLWYLAQHRLDIGIVGGESGDWQSGEGGSSKCALNEISTIERVMTRISQCILHWPNKDDYPQLASNSIPEREIQSRSRAMIPAASRRSAIYLVV